MKKKLPTNKEVSAWSVLRIYIKAVGKYPISVLFMFVGVLGMQAANLVAPLYLKQLFNILAANTPSDAVVAKLVATIGFIALWWMVMWISNRIEHFVNLRVIANVMADLTSQAFGYLVDHSYNFFISNFAGSLTHKVNKFNRSFQALYEGIFVTLFPTFVFVCGAIVVLYLRNPRLGIILGVWVVLFVLFQIWVTNLRQPLRRERSHLDTRVTATLADAIGNHSTIVLFSGGKYERALLDTVLHLWRKASIRSWNADAFIWSGVGLLITGIEILLLYEAVQFWSKGLLTIGDFVLIQAYLLTLFEKLVAIQHELRRFYDAFADGGEMVQILETPHGVQDKPQASKLETTKGEIRFESIGFNFHDERQILTDFSLTVAGGEKIALVGPSGAGKSTISRLLLRLYDVKSGAITIDKQNIRDITQDSLHKAIAFVPQEPVLFHRTLLDNVRYGRPEATKAEVIEAAKKAHCHEFISQLKDGYDTYVGERGIKLSGGERQRVAIARAILKNSPILVLDEATSSLDSESEALIQDALQTLMQGKTVIVIAHRLSTIMNMDRIVVLEGGKIAAEGTHQELVEHKGLYHKLWSIQAGGFIQDDGTGAEPKEDEETEEIATT
jgi:ATP-binding cassette subfamily B protein